MPQRRTTKAYSRRARPKLPEGDEGKDLSEKQRKEKLRVFLTDFDLELNEKFRQLEEDKHQLIVDVDIQFHTLISKTPLKVRKMKMEDFIGCGGTIPAALQWLGQNMDHNDSSAIYSYPQTSSRAGKTLQSISEDTTTCPDTAQKTTKRGTVRKTGRGKRGKVQALNDSTNMPPPSTSRAQSSRFFTPARGMGSLGWGTPLITPKFNPKLPTTPDGERAPRPGERLISMAGSPITLGTGKTSFIPITAGSKTLVLPEIPADLSLDQLSIPDVEGDTAQKIQKLHTFLSQYLQQHGTS